jgi:hypothetical protein
MWTPSEEAMKHCSLTGCPGTYEAPRIALKLACTVIKDLGEKLELPELYQLTDYHWLLLYEVLAQGLIPLNDWRVPEANRELVPLAGADDGYLKVRRRGRRTPPVQIDFDGFIDQFFGDTDFLLSTVVYEGLDPEVKRKLGANPELFGVIQGMAPHPDELRLEVWTAEEDVT